MRSRLFLLSLFALTLASIVTAGPLITTSDLGIAKSVTVNGSVYSISTSAGNGGAFSATVGSTTNAWVWCVDVNNSFTSGLTYLADVVALGNWTSTDKSHVAKANNTTWADGQSVQSALTRYQMAAYLITQYNYFLTNGSPNATDSVLQSTIWSLLYPTGGSGTYPGENSTYFNQAKNYVTANPTFGYGTWAVISGAVNADGSLKTDTVRWDNNQKCYVTVDNTYQTFLVQLQPTSNVPEPGTYAMLGAGLVGLGLLRRFRR